MALTEWGKAADRLMSDGAWHGFDEIVAAAGPVIPPGVAAREAERRRRLVAPGGRRNHSDVVAVGRRAKLRDVSHARVQRGSWEQDGDRYRATS